jgi:hypothetical protein
MTSVLNVTPHGGEGATWQSGGGLTADAEGNVYFIDGNGTFDPLLDSNGFPSQSDFGNAFIKASPSGGLAVADYFAPSNTIEELEEDSDLGSGAPMLLPDVADASGNVWHLAVGAGKDGNLYIVNLDQWANSMLLAITFTRKFKAFSPRTAFTELRLISTKLSTTGPLELQLAFGINNAQLTTSPPDETLNSFAYPGPSPSVSANNQQ